jgi:NDP-sugar pyrophosphorylase family protein
LSGTFGEFFPAIDNMTMWGFNQRIFAYMRRYPQLTAMPHILSQALIDKESVVANVYQEHWVHVAYPDDLNKSMLCR